MPFCRFIFLMTLSLFPGCMTTSSRSSNTSGVVGPFASGRWPKTNIKVCFTNLSDEIQPFADIIRKALEAQFNARTVYKFEGFSICGEDENIRVTIKAKSGRSFTQRIGFYVNNVPDGVTLFTKNETGLESRRVFTAIALHEFGHALGLMHEQLHADSKCKLPETVPADQKLDLTPYDEDSIMNYCTVQQRYYAANAPEPVLSEGDIETLNTLATHHFASVDLYEACLKNGGSFYDGSFCCHFPWSKDKVTGPYKICPADSDDAAALCKSTKGVFNRGEGCCWTDQDLALEKSTFLAKCADIFADRIKACSEDEGVFDQRQACCKEPKHPLERPIKLSASEAPPRELARELPYIICGSGGS